MRSLLKGTAQVIALIMFSWLMNGLAASLHLPIPGSILGILLLFFLLQTKLVRLEWVDLGAKWLLAEMLLFFIPSAVGILEFKSMLLENGLRALCVVMLSMAAVMAGSGLLAQKMAKRKELKH